MSRTPLKQDHAAEEAIVAHVDERSRTFRWYRYSTDAEPNPAFDGAAFIKSWARFVGSAHRHYKTGELVLCWSTEGPHPQEREMLRARLEANPGNVAAVLTACDERSERWNRMVEEAHRAAWGARP